MTPRRRFILAGSALWITLATIMALWGQVVWERCEMIWWQASLMGIAMLALIGLAGYIALVVAMMGPL